MSRAQLAHTETRAGRPRRLPNLTLLISATRATKELWGHPTLKKMVSRVVRRRPSKSPLGHCMKANRTNEREVVHTAATSAAAALPIVWGASCSFETKPINEVCHTAEAKHSSENELDVTRMCVAAAAKQSSRIPKAKIALVQHVLNNNFTHQLRSTMHQALTQRARLDEQRRHQMQLVQHLVEAQKRKNSTAPVASGVSLPATVPHPMPVTALQTTVCA